jgi:hypothetical protein
MGADGLRFLYQVKIGSRNYVNIPTEVQGFFEENYQEEIKYVWHYDKVRESVLVAIKETGENRSGWLQTTTHSSQNGRTTVPAKVTDIYNVSKGDNLYLLTHDLMGQAERPSILVWDLDRLEEELLSKNSGDNDLLSRLPNF